MFNALKDFFSENYIAVQKKASNIANMVNINFGFTFSY